MPVAKLKQGRGPHVVEGAAVLQEATCMVQTRMDVAKGYGTRQAAAQGQNEGLGAVWLQVWCVGCACMPQLDGGPGAGALLSPHSSWRLSEALACNSSRYGCSAASTKFSRAPVSWLQQGTKLVRGGLLVGHRRGSAQAYGMSHPSRQSQQVASLGGRGHPGSWRVAQQQRRQRRLLAWPSH